MFKTRKIPCYVLVFDQLEIIRKSLDFLTAYSKQLDIVVIENPSKTTPQIQQYVSQLGSKKLIRRYYLFDKNITSNAYDVILAHERQNIQYAQYVLVTDGDIVCPDSKWLKEEKHILKRHQDVFVCGTTLSLSNLPTATFPEAKNWIPQDMAQHRDYIEALTGGHLLLFRSSELLDFIDWKDKHDKHFVDGVLHRYCYDVLGKKWARTKKTNTLHLTWDLYSDLDHPYTKLKTGKSFQDTWYHSKTSPFTITNY